MRKMTLSGSLAMVNRNREMAGPKAMKVQPKNTAAVILSVCLSVCGGKHWLL